MGNGRQPAQTAVLLAHFLSYKPNVGYRLWSCHKGAVGGDNGSEEREEARSCACGSAHSRQRRRKPRSKCAAQAATASGSSSAPTLSTTPARAPPSHSSFRTARAGSESPSSSGDSRSTAIPTPSSTLVSSPPSSSPGAAVAAWGQGHRRGPPPRTRVRLLRGTRHREGYQREDRRARPLPVPLPPIRCPRVPARWRPAGRPLLNRHHGAQRQRRPNPRPHVARARARRVGSLVRW